LDNNREQETDIERFIKIVPKNKVFRIKTSAGHEITATEDHPFWTPSGMVRVKDIETNHTLAVYPFSGVRYEKPADRIIVDREDILELDIPCSKKHIISELEKRGLLPLRLDSAKTPFLIKALSYNMGDGTLYFTEKENKGFAWFYGGRKNLELIREDVKRIGFSPSRVYSRTRKHVINTKYGAVKFTTTEYSFHVPSRAFVALLYALGTPLGEKASQSYSIPDWIRGSPLWYKRLFLASMFGAELSAPSTITGHGYNFYMPYISVNKISWLVENGKDFLRQLTAMLGDFGIRTAEPKEVEEYLNRNLDVTWRIKLLIDGDSENLIRLFENVGFEYNMERKYLANAATQYLKLKTLVIEKRTLAQEQAVSLYRNGMRSAEIFEKMESPYVNRRFLERSLYEGRKTSPRIAFSFPTFGEFVKLSTRGLGKSGMVWDKVVSKEEVKHDGFVYDFTVTHDDHNFVANNFVVSNCGVRLLRSNFQADEIRPKLPQLLDAIFHNVPSGVGVGGKIKLTAAQLRDVLERGAAWAAENGYGTKRDIDHLEERGCMKGADASKVSDKALKRGAPQLGSLGAGNHFLEVQRVERIFLPDVAKAFGITGEGQVTFMIHSGSRGLGHQVCTDYLQTLEDKFRDEIRSLPDRELVYAPAGTKECDAYYGAMACGANFAWTNRQMIMHWVRESVLQATGAKEADAGIEVVYDVAHNIGKIEEHDIDGKRKKVYVHRKGATRAFPAGHPDIPADYRKFGQPVLIPGSMGTASYVLVGTETAKETFFSTAHGAGRAASRTKMRGLRGQDVAKQLLDAGILSKAANWQVLAEEAPAAYKDVDEVVRVCESTGIARIVAKLRPMAVAKG